MPAGRPRKPTAVHLLNGNPSKIKDLETREAQEPHFETYGKDDAPPPPDYLPDLAQECWNENAPMLAEQGLLTQADLHMLESYCVTYWAWRHCVDDLGKVGVMVYKPHAKTQPGSTYLDLLPQVRGMMQLGKSMLDLAREFGMTPAARGRMQLPQREGGEMDDMEKLLKIGY